MFWTTVLPFSSSTLKIERAGHQETAVPIYHTAQNHIPEDICHHDKPKFVKFQAFAVVYFIKIIFFWVSTRRLVKIKIQHFRAYWLSHLQG